MIACSGKWAISGQPSEFLALQNSAWMLAERIIASFCRSQFVLPWVKISGGRRLFPKLAQRSRQNSQFSLNIRRQLIRFHVEICTLAFIETIYIFIALLSALISKDRQGRSKCKNSTKLNTQRNFLYFQYLATNDCTAQHPGCLLPSGFLSHQGLPTQQAIMPRCGPCFEYDVQSGEAKLSQGCFSDRIWLVSAGWSQGSSCHILGQNDSDRPITTGPRHHANFHLISHIHVAPRYQGTEFLALPKAPSETTLRPHRL